MTDLIPEHGTYIDQSKNKVKCQYCCKLITGFTRLKHHLGGIHGDVVPCEKVPANVKILMRNELLERKKQKLKSEVGQLEYPNLSLKRKQCFQSDETVPGPCECTESTKFKQGKKFSDLMSENGMLKDTSLPCKAVDERKTVNCKLEDSLKNVFRCIGKFFYDAGIDFGAAKSPYFRRLLDVLIGCGTEARLPSFQELQGWILKEELNEINGHVALIKRSWVRTGCSILLDGWTDEKGRNLINFHVGCPEGVIFLRSADATESIGDVDAFISLIDSVIEEVGVKNVVQVITYDSSDIMKAAGEKLMEKHRTIFWTVCAVHCINLILGEFGLMDHVKGVLHHAKIITRYIYSHRSILELMKKHTHGRELIRPSRMMSATPFITLENISSEKKCLADMFNSSEWSSSRWASTTGGKRVANLVRESSFWVGAEEVVKASDPLVRVLSLIDGGHKPLMGYIYETMDQAKEAIKKNFSDKRAKYMPFWKIIDAVWDNHLHSPLHSAGYFLNPSFFYSSDFLADAEVANGLLCCILRMVEDQSAKDFIVPQLDMYRAASGGFSQEIAINQSKMTPPALWWSIYGGHSQELQRLAIRILSQTCSGTSSYRLKRSISEKVHAKGINSVEQQKLMDLAFVHYNLRLLHSQSMPKVGVDSIVEEEMDPMDDWLVDTNELGIGKDQLH